MSTDDERHPSSVPAPTRRTVPLTSRPAENRFQPGADQNVNQVDDQLDDGGGYWRARQRAGRRLFALAALAVGVQVVGLLLPDGHRPLENVLLVAPCPALLLTAGVLMPRPPAGFFRGWRAPHTSHLPHEGPDGFVFAVIAATLVPQQVLTSWLPSGAPDILAALTPNLISSGLGMVLLLVAVGLRERQHRLKTRSQAAPRRARSDDPAGGWAPRSTPGRCRVVGAVSARPRGVDGRRRERASGAVRDVGTKWQVAGCGCSPSPHSAPPRRFSRTGLTRAC